MLKLSQDIWNSIHYFLGRVRVGQEEVRKYRNIWKTILENIYVLFKCSLKVCSLCNHCLQCHFCQLSAAFKIHLMPWKEAAFSLNFVLFNIESKFNMAQKQQKICSKQQPNFLSTLTGEQAVITSLQSPLQTLELSFPIKKCNFTWVLQQQNVAVGSWLTMEMWTWTQI